jgi:nucleotide-binding universal stress UspA family protein
VEISYRDDLYHTIERGNSSSFPKLQRTMKKILVPTDFSENAANAIEYAAQIALLMHYKIMLLHVAEAGMDNSNETEKLEIICKALVSSYPDLDCNWRMVTGDDIPSEIVAASELFNAELIVMGTKGITNLEKILFGSNTASVIEKASRTVLSVPSSNYFTKPEKILFATTFEQEDVPAALQLVRLARPFGAQLIIAHVLTESSVEEIEKAKLQNFTREISMLANYSNITYRLCSENTVTMGLDLMIENTGADVIAMRTHRRSLFEKIVNPSITQKFARHSSIPLLAFHSA